MTQSGQEPPESGRRTADVSVSSGAPQEPKGANRRRRKRRSGKGSKGNQAGTAANGTPVVSPANGPVPVETANGPVEKRPMGPSTADSEGGGRKDGERKRKKRRRGRSKTAGSQIAAHDPSTASSGEGTPVQTDTLTSAKGKKAARRRGRRRRQASCGAGPQSQTAMPPGQTTQGAVPEARDRPNDAVTQKARRSDSPSGPISPDRNRGGRGGLHRARSSGARAGNAPLYAALDLGTNNCRLLIARPEERGFRVVDAYSRIVRLGEGVGSNRKLSDAAMDRAIDALAQCHRKLADRGVSRSRLIATEACRAAENGDDFIDRVKGETGLALEVVNRETEARLAVAGCASLVDLDADGVILFDIGGGSSEIVWLDLRNRCGARGYALTRFIRSWISLPVGVVNLAERHGGVHVTPGIFEAMVEDAADHLAAFSLAHNLTEAISSGRVHMLGTSGTVTTLAGVHLGLKRYDRRRVDGTWLADGDVSRMIDQLRDMPYEARVENPCIGADRADLVLAGCAILEAIRRRWTCSRLRVADRGLREGILTELMAADGVWSNRRSGHRHHRSRQRNEP